MLVATDLDRALGMDYYATETPGCGGVIRSSPEDFWVEEVYEDLRYEGGRYLILELEKKNWDTHHLVREDCPGSSASAKRESAGQEPRTSVR